MMAASKPTFQYIIFSKNVSKTYWNLASKLLLNSKERYFKGDSIKTSVITSMSLAYPTHHYLFDYLPMRLCAINLVFSQTPVIVVL